MRITAFPLRSTLPAVVAVVLLSLTFFAILVLGVACLVVAVLAVTVVLIAVVAVASVLVAVVAVALVGVLSVVGSVVGCWVLLVGLSLSVVAVAALPVVVVAVVAWLALCALLVLCVAVASFSVFVRRVVAVFAPAALCRCLAIALRDRVLRSLATTLGQWILLDVLAEELLDLMEGIHIVFVDQGDGNAVAVGTRRTSDAVNIVFGIVRNVVVDHHCDVVDVDTTGQDVRSHQDIDLSALELEHHIVALGLFKVGVHLTAVDVQSGESLVDVLHLLLAAREDDDAFQVTGLEDVLNDLEFLSLIADISALLNLFRRLAYSQFHLHRILQQTLCKFLNVLGHGG